MPDQPGENRTVKNIRVDGDRVTFIANAGHGAVWASFLYMGMTLALFLPSINDKLGYGVVILQALALPDLIAAFLHNLANWSRRTVFDGAAREARHANMLGGKQPLPFADAADFVRVRSGFAEGARYCYKLTRTGRRFGNGWELIPFRAPGDPALAFAEQSVLPALRLAIAAAKEENGAAPFAPPTRYKTDGAVHSLRARKKSPIFAALIAALLLVPFPTATLGIIVLFIAAAVHSALGMSGITLDPRERVMTVSHSPLGRKTAVAFDDVLGFEQLRTVSIFQPRSICLRYRDGENERSVLLYCGYSNGTAEAVAGETEFLLAGSPSGNARQTAPSNAAVFRPDTNAP